MIQVYQIIHGGVDLDPTNFFTASVNTRTRGHQWKLAKPKAVSRIRRHAFSVRTVNDWNSLPTEVVSATSVCQFKSRLDIHWADIHYVIPANE